MNSSKPMPEDESSALIGESSTCGIIAATIKQTIVFQKLIPPLNYCNAAFF
ncbi:hypothetical protein RCF98_02490 [Thiothrix lacustris]|uniref:Uncharacterized protein n=1 Tax=Thiothrix lacustris TaxID=525917 RepID=A0ABY9MTW0_9GAMM|nr:hypothetical protein [Thiothrix lacustris]WML91231.1 hypothetical protein RCF98_02490 [Thiothrix lacustris]